MLLIIYNSIETFLYSRLAPGTVLGAFAHYLMLEFVLMSKLGLASTVTLYAVRVIKNTRIITNSKCSTSRNVQLLFNLAIFSRHPISNMYVTVIYVISLK